MLINAKPVIAWGAAWLAGVAALGVFHFVFVEPRGQALAALRAEVATKAERFNELKSARSARAQDQRQTAWDELQQRHADFVFTSEMLNRLDFMLRAIAEENGLSDFSSRPTGTVSKIGSTELKRITERELQMSFNGSFPAVLRFINGLERHQPVVFVHHFGLQHPQGEGTELSCDMKCSILHSTGSQE